MRPAGEVGQAAWKGPLRHSVWSCCWPRRPEYVACFAFQVNREPMQDYVVRVVRPGAKAQPFFKCTFQSPSGSGELLEGQSRVGTGAAGFPYRTLFSCHFSANFFFGDFLCRRQMNTVHHWNDPPRVACTQYIATRDVRADDTCDQRTG